MPAILNLLSCFFPWVFQLSMNYLWCTPFRPNLQSCVCIVYVIQGARSVASVFMVVVNEMYASIVGEHLCLNYLVYPMW